MVEPGPIFEHLHSEFFAALEACRGEPDRKAVHALRATIRRLEALLTVAKQRRRGDGAFGRKVDKALKALKPVRAAAGPVRDGDVQLGLLKELLERKGAGLPAAERNVVSKEERKLQAKLEKRREDAAMELAAVISRLEDKEIRRISPLRSDVSGLKWNSLLKDARAVERRSARGLELADRESLHEYRKGSKGARYLAEMETDSVPAVQFAKQVKEVLDAIGAWHDWMLLTRLAKETLGKSSELARIVRRERELALRRAVRAVERLHRRA